MLLLSALAHAESPSVSLSGYGEGWAVHDASGTTLRLRRFVLAPAASLSERVGVDGEIELEDAEELELEQAFVHARVAKPLELRAGLLLVPLGIVNQHHEPPTFDGVDRPLLDQTLIPSTWRELGALAIVDTGAGLSVTAGALAGANGAGLLPWTLAGARNQGLPSSAADMAGVARVDVTRWPGAGIGAGVYLGGASGGDPSLYGTRLGVAEVDAKVDVGAFQGRVEGVVDWVDGADRITEAAREANASTDAIGRLGAGAYASAAFDVLRPFLDTDQQLRAFARYELLDPRVEVPDGVADLGASYRGQYLTAGLTWLPLPQLAVKADATFLLAGNALPGAGDRLSAGVGFQF